MSGIVGIYNLDGRPVEQTDIQRMLDSISHRGPNGSGIWIDGSVGLGCQLLRVTPESAKETQPFIHHSGTVVVFDGRLDNRKELLERLENSTAISASSPDPVFVLAAYDVFGDKFAEHLIGDFALSLFDLKRHKLLLARDAIGVRPIYFYSTPKQFLFASEIKAILTHPQVLARPNDYYLAEFLFLRLPGNDGEGTTFFKGINSLPPGYIANVTPEGLLKTPYWEFDVGRSIRYKSFEEYAEGFRHYFEQSVRRRLRSLYPVAVSVSGGLDSSSIFCMAETIKRSDSQICPNIHGVSYDSADGSPSDEKVFLLEIERKYSVSIDRIPIGPQGIMEGAKEEVWYAEAPFLDTTRNASDLLLRNVRQSDARTLMTGDWGDHLLFNQTYLVDLFHHLKWGEVWTHLEEFKKWYPDVDSGLFRQIFFQNLIRQYLPNPIIPLLQKLKRNLWREPLNEYEWFDQTFRKLARRNPSKQLLNKTPFSTSQAKSLYQEVKSRHGALWREWINKVVSSYGLEISFPFLDQGLISYMMAIPGEMQTYQGVPKRILRKAMDGVLPIKISERRGKADFTHLINAGVERDYPQLVQCIQSGKMAVRFGYVNEDAMSEQLTLVKDHIRRPDCVVSWSLNDLLGLELWLHVFFNQ